MRASRNSSVDSETQSTATQSTLLAVLNSGYRRGPTIPRCVPPSYEPVDFPTFAPVVVAGIRPSLTKAFETRTITIEMQRPLPDEYPEVFEHSKETADESEELRGRIVEWADQNLDTIGVTRPSRPDGIVGRKAECWMPLLTVAEVAGGQWPDCLRAAVKELGLNGRASEGSYSHELLADTREVFGDRDRIHSADLIDGLNDLEEHPWHTWNDGNGIRPIDFHRRVIQHYGLHSSASMRIGDKNLKGYEREWFGDAWARFCPPAESDQQDDDESSSLTPDPLPVTPVTTFTPQGNQPIFYPSQDGEPWDPEPLQDNGCDGVTGNDPQKGVTDPEQLLEDEFGATVVGDYLNGDTIPDEYGGGTYDDIPTWERQPADALEHNVRLGAQTRERYRRGDKVESKALTHVWAVCDVCGEGTMRPKNASPKRCCITPGCEGSHRP